MKYNLVVCGGTFDHFHKGHREFLRYCLSISNKLLVGLTTNAYIKVKNNNGQIEDYKVRKQGLDDFFYKEKAKGKVWIEPIDDIYLPKIWDLLGVEVIVVSKDTILAAEKINLRRKEQEKSPLIIKIFASVKSSDNEYISSSRIRNGEIDREGRAYVNPLWLSHKLYITEALRKYAHRPFGKLLQNNVILIRGCQTVPPHPESPIVLRDSGQARMTQSPHLITVGDVTTKTFNDLSLNQNISVIDFKVARKKKYSNIKELGFSGREKIIKISNPAGCLTPDLFKAVYQLFKFKTNKRRIILQIEGEEDLSVLPLTLAAPLGSVIFYGQPGEGVVKVKVSEKSKEMAFNFVRRFRLRSASTRGH